MCAELDEHECDERRQIYSTDVGDLERQFALLREQLYKERLHQVDQRLSSLRSEEAPEYLTPLNQLQESYSVRLEVSAITCQLKIQTINTMHEAELLAAKQNFEVSWLSLVPIWDKIIHEIITFILIVSVCIIATLRIILCNILNFIFSE